MLRPVDTLTCEICATSRFDPVPGGQMLVCRTCRLVYLPRPSTPPKPPAGRTDPPAAPDLRRYGRKP